MANSCKHKNGGHFDNDLILPSSKTNKFLPILFMVRKCTQRQDDKGYFALEHLTTTTLYDNKNTIDI